MILTIIFTILHILVSGLYVFSALAFKKAHNIEITIYNLPTVIIALCATLSGIALFFTHIFWYLPTSIIVAIVVWLLYSTEYLKKTSKSSIPKRLILSTLVGLFWPQTLAFISLVFFYPDKFLPPNESA